MPDIVWTEATRDAIDAVHLTRSGRLVVLSLTTSGPPPRVPPMVEAFRHLTPTAARVLAGQLTDAADLIDYGPPARETLATLRRILWPPEDPGADWNADTLDAIAETMTRAGIGRAPDPVRHLPRARAVGRPRPPRGRSRRPPSSTPSFARARTGRTWSPSPPMP
jgi:hypothetical protein